MSHFINAIFELHFAFEDFEASIRHHASRWINFHNSFKNLSCLEIFSLTIEPESGFIGGIETHIRSAVARINEFINARTSILSFDGDIIKFSQKKFR